MEGKQGGARGGRTSGEAAEREEALLRAAQQGDRRAFGQLVRLHRPRIVALGLQLTGCRQDAEDVAQETFLRAWRHLGGFQGRSAFGTWLYRIALRRALSLRSSATQRLVRAVPPEDPRLRAAVAVDAGSDPQRALQLREQYAALLGAFDALSGPLRATVALTVLHGLSHAEAAEVLGVREGTVAWRVHEARRRLREALQRASSPTTGSVQRTRASGGDGLERLLRRLAEAAAGWPAPAPRGPR